MLVAQKGKLMFLDVTSLKHSMVYLINNRVTSLADRLKIDFALIHSDRTRGSNQARCSPTIPGTPENDASGSSNNNLNSNNLFYLTSNTADHNTTEIRSSDNGDDDEFSSAISITGEAPSMDDETSVITLVGDVAGKVAFIVVSYFFNDNIKAICNVIINFILNKNLI